VRAEKAGLPPVLLRPNDVKGQICELMKHYSLETEPVMERCTDCNTLLRKAAGADRERIEKEVPSHLINEVKEFRLCDRCGKIYWRGSQWRNIKKMSGELNDCCHD
jgi:uncharacterized protein